MAQLTLKSIHIRNWQQVHDAEIEFPDKGLVLVTGSNRASNGKMDSVGCHAKGQLVLLHDGRLAPVESITVGDKLMGPDSAPREVMKLCRGRGKMFKIVPLHGHEFIINEDHILALYLTPGQYIVDKNSVRCRKHCNYAPTEPCAKGYFTVSVKDFLNMSRHKRDSCKLYTSDAVDFSNLGNLKIPPRILGLWLGDGHSRTSAITTADAEVENEWISYATRLGLSVRCQKKHQARCKSIFISAGSAGRNRNKRSGRFENSGKNTVLRLLKEYNLINNKHIPFQYKTASRNDRLNLLSGLLDSDGYYANKCFYFYSTSKTIATDTAFLARSLGFTARLPAPRFKKCQTGNGAWCYTVSIFGRIEDIPTHLLRKKADKSNSNRQHNVTGFSIKHLDENDFYGFTLDRDGLYLLDDFTVTHNSGKTSLGEAISRSLVGVTGKFSKLGDYSHNDKGNTYIDLRTTLNDQPLRVEMGFKCKELSRTGEGLRYTIGQETPIERGHLTETREELTRVVNVTPELAQWTVFIDGDNLKFSKLSEKDAVDVLMWSLQQPPWTFYAEKSSKALQNAKRDLATDQAMIEEARRRLQSVIVAKNQAQDALKTAQRAFDEEVARNHTKLVESKASQSRLDIRAQELVKTLADIRKRLKEIEDEKARQHHELEKQRNKIERELTEHRAKRDTLHAPRAEAQAKIRQEEQALAKMKSVPKNCPTCGKAWDKAYGQEELERQQTSIVEAQKALDTFAANLRVASTTVQQYETTVREIDADIRNLGGARETATLSNQYEESDRELNRIKDNVRSLQVTLAALERGPDNSTLLRAKTVFEERQEEHKKASGSVEETSTKLFQSQEVLKIVDYWNRGFGPFGIPNMVLGEVINPLNEIARRISLLMTGGTIEVTYATSRALASGDSKAELTVNVNNRIGSKKIAGNSKGESGLTNLIIAETLSEVGQVSNRIGYRWYDEVLNSQDPAVRKSILSYMKQVAHTLGILIFVVDHHQETANFADYILIAEKTEDDGTTFKWA